MFGDQSREPEFRQDGVDLTAAEIVGKHGAQFAAAQLVRWRPLECIQCSSRLL